jgi:hypothetical protein
MGFAEPVIGRAFARPVGSTILQVYSAPVPVAVLPPDVAHFSHFSAKFVTRAFTITPLSVR